MSSGTNDAENRSDPQQPIEAVKPSGLVSKLLNATTVLIAAVFFITLAAGSITALHLKAEADAQHPIAPPVGVTTERIKIVNGYDRVAHYTGRLEPARETDLAFERTGLVTRMARDEGDSIRKGEVVATLDTALLDVGRKRLEARKRELKIQLELAELTLGRQSELEKRGWSPEQRLDEARTTRARLSAAIEQVKAEIAAIDIDRAKSTLRAPFDGRIAARFVDEGAVVAAGTSVVRLLENGRRQARIGVPPRLAATLTRDQSYGLVAGKEELRARLVARRPDLQTGTRTVTALFDIEDGGDDIAFGDVVRLDLKSKVDERGAWVPLTALKEGRRGMWTLLTVDHRSKHASVVKPETVEVLHARGDEVFVRGSFQDGTEIINDATDRVVAGQRIALIRE
jgi:RND family efflux transporter MFP subunit